MSSRKLLCLASLSLSIHAAFAAPSAGDIAFTAYNTDEDGWSIVVLSDLAADSTLYFTDSNWDGATFTSAEGVHRWNSGASVIAAGTVVRFSAIDQAARAVSIGSLSSSGNAALSSSGDTLLAFVGASAASPDAFLAGVSSESAANAAAALAAAGLGAGAQALALPSGTDYAFYSGPRSGLPSMTDYLGLLGDKTNWTVYTDGNHADAVPDTSAFSVSAVPEVDRSSLLLAGLGVIAAAALRLTRSESPH
ncbi:hypothetical protein [Methyloversatilis thermotolerans]|uniref:hypothetical protein n=1 Tax=Methyloversatilis thermotolerans TaxID=1346290 RepID=UPI00037D109D|nr:hypothetical protein [Methyloversatilis thermotolerans]